MRKSEEQLGEILKRSVMLKEKQKDSKKILLYGMGMTLCVFLMCLTAFIVPSVIESAGQTGAVRYGSLILSAGHMGYVIIALLAFILGILVTLFCYHIKEIRRKQDAEK